MQEQTTTLPEAPQPNRERSEQLNQPAGNGEPGALAKLIRAPATGGTVAGTVVLGAAVLWGPLEAALGVGAAYATYRLARKRRSKHREQPQSPQPQAVAQA